MTLMVMIKLMTLCGAMNRVIVFAIEADKFSPEPVPNSNEIPSNKILMVLIGLYQQPGNCSIDKFWEKVYRDCDL